jgi:hypothetical protein
MADNQNDSNEVREEPVIAATPTSIQEELRNMKGAFVTSLQRNNRQIRDDRALTIGQKTKRAYKRYVEDLMDSIREMKLTQDSMLDLSATDKNSLIVAANFDQDAFVRDDSKLGLDIRNTEIKLEVAIKRYEYLFGETISRV